MSKKFIIIISLILALLGLSLMGYYFILQNNPGSPDGKILGFKNFFPFGGSSENNTSTTTSTENPTVIQNKPEIQNFTQKLRRLSAENISGAGTLDVVAGTVVRYIERATGHIFEVELFSPNQNRISNTTIPLVYNAVWGNKNSSIIARYLKDDNHTVDTYSVTIKEISTSTDNRVSALVFPENISDVSVFDTSVFYLEQKSNSSVGTISNFDGSKKKIIWDSPLKELSSQYVNSKTVALSTKPLESLPGFMYFVDTGTGAIKSILSNISGLSTLVNNDETGVLYSENTRDSFLYVFDVKNKSSKLLDILTFPEKCVWSKKEKGVIYCAIPRDTIKGDSLTSWYKGFISFNDDIWKYDTKTNIANILGNLSEESGEVIDVVKPILSENEQYLIFINRNNGSLWSLDLTK